MPGPLDPETISKRRDVLAAAQRLFARHGYEKTSIKDLASGANVAIATIYANFDGKLGVLEALLDDRIQAILARLGGLTLEDPLERYLEGVRIVNGALADDPFLRGLAGTATAREPRLVERSRQLQAWFDGLSTGALKEVIQSGRLECDDPEALTVLLRVATHGWIADEGQRPQPVSHDRVLDLLIGMIRRGSRPVARTSRAAAPAKKKVAKATNATARKKAR